MALASWFDQCCDQQDVPTDRCIHKVCKGSTQKSTQSLHKVYTRTMATRGRVDLVYTVCRPRVYLVILHRYPVNNTYIYIYIYICICIYIYIFTLYIYTCDTVIPRGDFMYILKMHLCKPLFILCRPTCMPVGVHCSSNYLYSLFAQDWPGPEPSQGPHCPQEGGGGEPH